MAAKKIVLKTDLHSNKDKLKVLKAISALHGVDSISVDMRDSKITVVGLVDAVDVVAKLRRKLFSASIISLGPAKEPERVGTKGDGKKDGDVGMQLEALQAPARPFNCEIARRFAAKLASWMACMEARLHSYGDEEGKTADFFPMSPIAEEFTLEFLKSITHNFSDDCIIRRSRYGAIYKGVRDNGKCIAVMKLCHQKPMLKEVFKSEISKLTWVQHLNTVQLVGYCHHIAQVPVEHKGEHVSARVEERFLCFEYLEGPTLDKHISNKPCKLHWHTCYMIIMGICKGLHYLHKGPNHPTIYHLDLKPTNILLDRYMMPKIGYFGLSRIFASLQTNNTTECAETSVYLPPEYIYTNQISQQFDVFSLGVIIIQIMAGKEGYSKCANTSSEEFIQIVHELWAKRMPVTIFRDTSCEIKACIEIALKCVKSDLAMRPTITDIIDKLGINKIYTVDQLYFGTREFTLNFLNGITNNFSMQNIVGRGGYGVVYRGVLDNGEEIAVKKFTHPMPWICEEELKKELNNLSTAQHENIIPLVGYCHHTEQKTVPYKGEFVSATVEDRALCLEYLQGGSLDKHLSDDDACKLNWDTCYNIIKGICQGLNYLHNGSDHHIYHLDLKPENILLDKDMMPKIGDFGLSKILDSMKTYKTLSDDVKGTRGYMPPEYINGQDISSKFDIYSLGVIIIRMMAGKKGHYASANTSPKKFIKIVHGHWLKKLDMNMSYHASQEIMTCIKIALRCVEADRGRRPTIIEILNELSEIETSEILPKSTSQVLGFHTSMGLQIVVFAIAIAILLASLSHMKLVWSSVALPSYTD